MHNDFTYISFRIGEMCKEGASVVRGRVPAILLSATITIIVQQPLAKPTSQDMCENVKGSGRNPMSPKYTITTGFTQK